MTTGRQVFRRFQKPLSLLSRACSYFPIFFTFFLIDATANFNGRLAAAFRYILLKHRFLSCGTNVYIGPNVRLKGIENIAIGTNVSIHDACYIDGTGGVIIGNDVSIAHQCSIVSFNHGWLDKSRPIKYNATTLSAIEIKNDVWLGCGVRVLAGVKIDCRVVIAAGAVVVNDVPANVLAAGVPARVLKSI